uniref:Uncharacterized protein n=2 Tax=Araneus ventricosus TaxID=182803 RepID=A0A4Y2PJB2_ARAVE|nr:hypothetical protein AVEN_232972-1 [Araneus ventricosus]GBN52065.1 hypothetical protein AVEN_147576-1 [Araneus ventricosus]GBN52075.1 hypothetical protein AVEN_205764-1 [Araneus ventricosus]
MKSALPEPATAATPAKKPSISDNTDGFTTDSIPPHYYHLGEDNYAVGVSFSPFVWESLSDEIQRLALPAYSDQVIVIRDTHTSAWIENVPHVSLLRYVTKHDFSRQFLPSVCLLTETE